MADDTIPQDVPRKLTTQDILSRACDWSDYRKDYGVSANEDIRRQEHSAFKAGWQARHNYGSEPS